MATNIGKISTGLPSLNYTAGGSRINATFPIPKGYKKVSGSFGNASTYGTASAIAIVYNNATVYSDTVTAATKSFTRTFNGNSDGYISYSLWTSEENAAGTFSATVTS